MDGTRPIDKSVSSKLLSHVVYTRFNLDSHLQAEGMETWTAKRLNLFKQFCLPSVINQSNQDFNWLIFYDKRTSSAIKEQLVQSTASRSNIHWIECNGNEDYAESGKNHLLSFLDSESQYFITTRLDNDDSLEQRYVGDVQELARQEQDLCVLNFGNGQILDINRGLQLRSDFQKSNPFISLVAPNKGNETQCAINNKHKTWLSKPYYKEVSTEFPKWLQVVHDGNISNKVKGAKLDSLASLKNFGIDVDQLIKQSPKTKGGILSRIKSWLST